MQQPGEKLRQARERLKLTYRDVVQASRKIALRRNSEEFVVALSRLADIENKGTLPTIYRLYTLCAIYRLDYREVLRWYGIPLDSMPADAIQIGLNETHALHFPAEEIQINPPLHNHKVDLDQTIFLSHFVGQCGKIPLIFLGGQDQRHLHYGFIGLADWSMHPILQPGSLVLIDPSRRKIAIGGWTSELDRPIYFLEHRDGYRVGWCAPLAGRLLLQTHPAGHEAPTLFDYSDIDIIGQVTGVAMLLESKKRGHARASTIP